MGLDDTTARHDRGCRPLVLAVELPDASFEVPLPEEGLVVIGRSRSADVHIDHPSVSRQHARLRLGKEPTITNLRARNGLFVGGHPVGDHEEAPVEVGAEIELGEAIVQLRRQRVPRSQPVQLPRRVLVQVLARGGKVTFGFDRDERVAYLAERRLDLVILLLRPPPPLQPGDPVPDETLLRMIWPRRAKATRVDVNTLIARTRRDLVNAGINATCILRRTPGGGATQLVLQPGAEVVVDA